MNTPAAAPGPDLEPEASPSLIAASWGAAELVVPAGVFATGWNAALARPTPIAVRHGVLDQAAPASLSLRFTRPPLKTISFTFPEAPHWQPAARRPGPAGLRRTATRPPPPRGKPHPHRPARRHHQAAGPAVLRAAAAAGIAASPPAALEFPFEPFPYQLAGIAFLYPRHAAVLADEMGLGKTMQAITAIRLLLYAGEVRHVLLVCPKPLVTNWRREFTLWAPEVPLAIIEGDRARRQWQWRQPQTPVQDRQLRTADARPRRAHRTRICTSTWWCWTKPSGSRTAPAPPARSCGPSPAPAAGP